MSWVRWLKFNAVGAMGLVAQLAALVLLRDGMRVDYLVATALAVEFAVLHNFAWHELWTWRDRRSAGNAIWRLLRFNCSTGLVSLAANLVLMRLLVGNWHVQYLLANLLSVATASLANFVLNDAFVFRGARPGVT